MVLDESPVLGEIHKERGVAGQVAYRVAVTYPGESARVSRFVGNVLGGPVWAELDGPIGGVGVWVRDPGRFGEFGPEWVRRFYAAS
jgi:hypothetical protein